MKILLIASILSLTACVPYTQVLSDYTAGAIGCPSEDIKVTKFDHKFITSRTEYTAECHGHKFICNKPDRQALNVRLEATCKEMI
ncbi:MAG: hypothetical protein PHO08_08580 [Methylococcales bacterium]|nr:hypothetical protein [Methylococcales bacterium]MDD5631698.1 hypothetical protein [Methylococcales bacterium]